MEGQLKEKVVKGLIWRFMERCGAQGITFVVSIILARLLSPYEFGIISLVTIFTNILLVFTDSGLAQALVQKLEVSEEDYSSAFWMNSFLAIVLYGITFFAAPFLAGFYQMNQLTPVIRVLALTIIIGGVKGVLQAYIQKNMQFKKFFYATLVGTVASAIVGIYLAFHGAGVWALVFQQLTNQAIDTIILWVVTPCKFSFFFSIKRIKEMYAFGSKILYSHLIDQIYNNMYSLVIGKAYSETDLAYYDKGKQFPFYLVNNINNSINMVIFPALSSLQNEKIRLHNMIRISLRVGSFIIFPMMAGLAAIAPDFIQVVLTDKWMQCVPFLRFCCFTYALTPIHTTNLQAINAIGRSDIYLKLEIKKKMVGILILLVTLPKGLYVMMVGRCLNSLLSLCINIKPNKEEFHYGIWEQMKDLMPAFILSIVMGSVVMIMGGVLRVNIYIKILIQIIAGIIVYCGLAKMLRLETLQYIEKMLLKDRKKQ